MVREGRGRYRIGDFSIVRETWRIWRVWWLPLEREGQVRAGVAGEGFPTLREACASVDREIEMMRG